MKSINEKLTLQELHNRLSSYLHYVENKNCLVTNHNYCILTSEEFGSIKIDLKLASIIDGSEFHRHIAFFYKEIDETSLYIIPDILREYIDKDEFKNLRIEGKIVYEDNRKVNHDDILFTGKVYIETNILLIEREKAYQILNEMNIKYKGKNLSFSIRENLNWDKMDKNQWPSVFLCHDSKDKEKVELIYKELSRKSINVWYDKYSLSPGDSLTEKISEGLNQSSYGIVFISKEFLSNEKWVKFELQTLISKQIYTKSKTIIPLWLEIEEKDLEQHHWLRDKLAIKFSDDIESTTNEIIKAIKPSK